MFDWEYNKDHVGISMPNCVIDALKILQHTQQQPQYSTFVYGKAGQRQYTTLSDTSQFLTSKKTIQVKSVLDTFLYYSRAIDGTILTAINDIGTQQAEPTKNTQQKNEKILNYAATYSHAKLRFHASGMILQVD